MTTIPNPEKIIYWAEDKASVMRDMSGAELEAAILRGVAAVLTPGHMELVELQYLVSACKVFETKMLAAGFTLPHREPTSFADDVGAKLKHYMDVLPRSEYELSDLMIALSKLLQELYYPLHGVPQPWRGFYYLREVAARALSTNYCRDKEAGIYEP